MQRPKGVEKLMEQELIDQTENGNVDICCQLIVRRMTGMLTSVASSPKEN